MKSFNILNVVVLLLVGVGARSVCAEEVASRGIPAIQTVLHVTCHAGAGVTGNSQQFNVLPNHGDENYAFYGPFGVSDGLNHPGIRVGFALRRLSGNLTQLVASSPESSKQSQIEYDTGKPESLSYSDYISLPIGDNSGCTATE